MNLEQELEQRGIYLDPQRYGEALGAGDTDIQCLPELVDIFRDFGRWILKLNDIEADNG